ncbi:hypothetical protein O181_008214 [Austropuccinia psidii MF-1]|uniref:Uncharacterized protein n=1 Tax=Austropuccinia psidii MF-1 TaxID=1389203 RepID=A0A9Q3BNG0_9BASI|nr:hypothetical protein [Austropuccinia psidii MF-1]
MTHDNDLILVWFGFIGNRCVHVIIRSLHPMLMRKCKKICPFIDKVLVLNTQAQLFDLCFICVTQQHVGYGFGFDGYDCYDNAFLVIKFILIETFKIEKNEDLGNS